MLKRLLFAVLCATGAARADTDTPPVLNAIPPCVDPRMDASQSVKLSYRITETGVVENITITQSSGDPRVDERVVACVAHWTYRPATHNGVAVAVPKIFTYHGARIEDLTGDRKAFADLERDADKRCQKLYPVKREFLDTAHTLSLVAIARLPSGEVQTTIEGSAGERADKNAMACLKDIVKNHDDLPATFKRTIAVDWSHRR
jgi:TonB family protein